MNRQIHDKTRILLVDDDEDLLILMQRRMESEGFAAKICPNAENITTLIEDWEPDIIILDIHMRGIDGGKVCSKLKHDPYTAEIPVLMLSANDDISKIATECGADGFVSKPFNSAEVKSKVQIVLDHNNPTHIHHY